MLRFVNVVWGKKYTEGFVHHSLPTLLADGNLPAAVKRWNCRFSLYTTSEDASILTASAAWKKLCMLMPVEVIHIQDVTSLSVGCNDKYSLMTACHRHHIGSADEDSALVFLSPDMLVSGSALSGMLAELDEGARVVLCCGLRVSKEGALQALESYRSDIPMSVPERELVRVAIEHPHEETRSFFWDKGGVACGHPSLLIWRVGLEGLLIRGFHFHPLAIWPSVRGVLPEVTIDRDFLSQVCPQSAEYAICQDSDLGVIFTFCEESEEQPCARLLEAGLAQWISASCDDMQRTLAQAAVYMKCTASSPSWRRAEADSRSVVTRLLKGAAYEDLLRPPSGTARLGLAGRLQRSVMKRLLRRRRLAAGSSSNCS